MANRGERVLGVAYLPLPGDQYPEDFVFDTAKVNFPMENLIFLGLVALFDPPRMQVPSAIDTLKDASVSVKMVTGDHPGTAASIARQVGIISRSSKIDRMENLNKMIADGVTEIKYCRESLVALESNSLLEHAKEGVHFSNSHNCFFSSNVQRKSSNPKSKLLD